MNKLLLVPTVGQEDCATIERPPAGEPAYLGIDVSRTKWVYCLRWKGGERRLTTPGMLEHLKAVVSRYEDCELHVVYEACGFGFEIAWYLQKRGIDVMVVAPSQIERAPGRRVKTDRIDASNLARKREEGGLKGIYIPSREDHELRQLARTYLQARKERRRQQTRIRALLQEHAILGPLPAEGWSAYASWLRQQTLPPPVEQCVEILLALRQAGDQCAKRLRAAMLASAPDPLAVAVVKAIAEQPGIGQFSAAWLRLELIDIRRFAQGKALVHYLGLTPSEYSTGEIVRRGHILKCGPAVLRTLLVECAWRSIRKDHGDPELRRFYDRLRAKGLQSKQAIVAVTRKLALRVYARWSAAITAGHNQAV
jgi:transposase